MRLWQRAGFYLRDDNGPPTGGGGGRRLFVSGIVQRDCRMEVSLCIVRRFLGKGFVDF